MTLYYVNTNAQSNGDHEVHTGDCDYLPKLENRILLGYFTNCEDAVKKAKEYYTQSNGCFYCSNDCHVS